MGTTMAEPPGNVLQPGTTWPDGLLATKLHMPGLRPGLVARPRLLDRLDQGLARDLILVCAPAGFGKTVLLADWARRGRWPIAWLSLDTADNDPARFWRHAIAALDPVCTGIAERIGPLLGPPPPRLFDGLVAALINELAATADPTLLVLDDYHLVDSPQVHASVAFLLGHRPPGLRLVLACRADPPLSLARLRGRGQLAELRAADIRFTAEEASALLSEAAGPSLSEAAVAALAERTEGWAAGLQLAGLSLRGRTDADAFVASFSGSHRHVLDYLTEEVLDRQPAEVRGFLLETSILDRLSGALCDAVTGHTDGQAMLERLERANLFLVPLDEVRGWWRYHHLFADLLRARLREEQPGQVALLHRNAAAWHDQHGLADDAVRHALAAGDATWAARLVERHADELLLRSERATLARWLAALPADAASARPRVLLAQALSLLVGGRAEEVGRLLDAAERSLAGPAADEPFEPSAGRARSLLANVTATSALERAFLAELHGDADRQLAFGRQALANLDPDDHTLSAIIHGHLGVAQWLGGRLPEAQRTLTSSISRLRAIGERFLVVRVCEHLGQVQRARADLDAALGTYRQALEIAAPPGQPALPAAGIAHVGLAEVAYQRGEFDAALRHLAEGISSCRQLIFSQPAAAGLATLAWIRQAQGDPAGALEAMDEAERAGASGSVAGVINSVPAQRARLLLLQGDLEAAVSWTTSRGLDPGDEPDYPREPEYLALARVLIAQDRPGQAVELLGRLHTCATAQGRTGSLIEILALRALGLAARGEDTAAVAALTEALRLACPQGYIRVFADEGPAMSNLLGRLIAAQRAGQSAGVDEIPFGYLGRLARAARQDAAGAAPPSPPGPHQAAVPGLIEPLSSREAEVLQLLAAGRPNKEIAEELVVAISTVKKHVTHIFEKLGAANRTQATARARELGLLP
jgi:LuxR family transcriptional regulator, maltose regulon positive regulatory protein